jgi:hypothetical protein
VGLPSRKEPGGIKTKLVAVTAVTLKTRLPWLAEAVPGMRYEVLDNWRNFKHRQAAAAARLVDHWTA